MMIPLVAFLLVAQAPEPIMRLEAFLKSHPSLSVDVTVTTSRGEKGKGTLKTTRPNNLNGVFSFSDATYTITSNSNGSLLTNSKLRLYEQLPWATGADYILSPIVEDDLRMLLPFPLFSGNVLAGLPKETMYRLDGKAVIHGIQTDHIFIVAIHGKFRFVAHFYIDAEGKLLKAAREAYDSAPLTVTTELSDYKFQALPENTFQFKLPSGFVPVEFPVQRNPLGMDSKVPSGALVHSRSGAKADLAALIPSSGMFAVVDGAWVDSANGKDALAKVREALKADGGPLVLISDEPGKGSSSAEALYRDPTGGLLGRIRPMGSPMFFLVSKKNVVERLWYGYNPADAHFLSELKEAIAHPESSRQDK